jgi:hypothetical protein
MIKSREDVKDCMYNHLKEVFEDYVNGWIHEDFFKDPVSGFKHFEHSFDGDNQFNVVSTEFEYDQEFTDYCYDLASDIASNLKCSDFMHSACQMFY